MAAKITHLALMHAPPHWGSWKCHVCMVWYGIKGMVWYGDHFAKPLSGVYLESLADKCATTVISSTEAKKSIYLRRSVWGREIILRRREVVRTALPPSLSLSSTAN